MFGRNQCLYIVYVVHYLLYQIIVKKIDKNEDLGGLNSDILQSRKTIKNTQKFAESKIKNIRHHSRS